jgi:hypothetical protein
MKFFLAPMQGLTGYTVRNAFHHHFDYIDKYYTPFIPAAKRMNAKIKRDIDPVNNDGITLIPQAMSIVADEGIDLLRNLVVWLQPGHGVKIEAQGTSHIPKKSRRRQPHGIVRREEAGQLFGGFPLLGDLDRQGFHPIDIDTDLPAEDLEGSFVLQLIDVTALFAGGLVIGMSAIEHPHVLGPLQQTVMKQDMELWEHL